MRRKVREQVSHMEFLNRENDFRHSDYEEEIRVYRYVRDGDPRALEESRRKFTAGRQGHLSDDPLTNMRYLFVASMTLIIRFAITGGMNSETAYTSSDYYIQQMDRCKSIEEVRDLHLEAVEYFTNYMADLKKEKIYSKTVMHCMNYISCHLNRPVCVTEIAAQVKRNPDYLSSLFKKETGSNFSEYLTAIRMKNAKRLLDDASYTVAQVAEMTGYRDVKHFSGVFQKFYNISPAKYRK